MKALTLTQPWASLVVAGVKRFATRTWSYRLPWDEALGQPLPIPLAIHAAKGWTADDREFADYLDRSLGYGIGAASELPRGAVAGTVRLLGCTYSYPETRSELFQRLDMDEAAQEAEMELGDWSDGRLLWEMDGPVMFGEPIPARGALGLWNWNDPR